MAFPLLKASFAHKEHTEELVFPENPRHIRKAFGILGL